MEGNQSSFFKVLSYSFGIIYEEMGELGEYIEKSKLDSNCKLRVKRP